MRLHHIEMRSPMHLLGLPRIASYLFATRNTYRKPDFFPRTKRQIISSETNEPKTLCCIWQRNPLTQQLECSWKSRTVNKRENRYAG